VHPVGLDPPPVVDVASVVVVAIFVVVAADVFVVVALVPPPPAEVVGPLPTTQVDSQAAHAPPALFVEPLEYTTPR
jgi:hypothetical protein